MKIGIPDLCSELKFARSSVVILWCIKILEAKLWMAGLEICCFLEDLCSLPRRLTHLDFLVELSEDQSSEKINKNTRSQAGGLFS